MDWLPSDEGQVCPIGRHGNMTSLKSPPLTPAGFDQERWIEEWNRTSGYRQ
jgi:hypothetical protein